MTQEQDRLAQLKPIDMIDDAHMPVYCEYQEQCQEHPGDRNLRYVCGLATEPAHFEAMGAIARCTKEDWAVCPRNDGNQNEPRERRVINEFVSALDVENQARADLRDEVIGKAYASLINKNGDNDGQITQ